jgi:hypothetical protein
MSDSEKVSRGRAKPAPMPVEDLRKLFRYDRETGLLWWLVPTHGRRMDQPAGSPSGGYISLMLDGSRYQAHRIIYFLETGEWILVDHRDGDGLNNAWGNLRRATKQQNGWNMPGRGMSGYKGVYPTASGKWTARIKIGGKILNSPSRDTPEEAFADYCAAAVEHHGQFARLS